MSFDGSRLVLAIETAGLADTFRRGAHPAWVQEALMEVLGLDARVECVAAAGAPDAGRLSGVSGSGPVTTPAAVSGRPSRAASQQPDHPAGHRAEDPPVSRPAAAPTGTGAPAPPPAMPAMPTAPPAVGGAPGSGGSEPEPAGPAGPADPVPVARAAHTGAPAAPPQSDPQDWSSAPPPATTAPSWATDGDDPIERAPARGVVPPIGTARVAEVVDDPDSISADDEDIETSGEIGQAVVERLLGGTVISESDE
jgi:DNA polymerase-3 subunit gamma/tau